MTDETMTEGLDTLLFPVCGAWGHARGSRCITQEGNVVRVYAMYPDDDGLLRRTALLFEEDTPEEARKQAALEGIAVRQMEKRAQAAGDGDFIVRLAWLAERDLNAGEPVQGMIKALEASTAMLQKGETPRHLDLIQFLLDQLPDDPSSPTLAQIRQEAQELLARG